MDSHGDPAQVLDVLRDVLVKHMDSGKALPQYRVQSAVFIGKHSGRLISDDHIISGNDAPGGLRLTMRSGHEFDLTLNLSQTEEKNQEEEEAV